MKKITNLLIIIAVVFGYCFPVVAALQVKEPSCDMACCLMVETEKAQASTNDSCDEMNSCLPGDQTAPGNPMQEAEVPSSNLKKAFYPVEINAGKNLTSQITRDPIRGHFTTIRSELYRSTRQKLTDHSVLLI